jgi:hypothetical protein
MISGPGVAICSDCVQEFVQILLHIEASPVETFASLDYGPCSFCAKLEGSSAVRLQGPKALICAACIALDAEILLDADGNEGTYTLRPDARAELERATAELVRMYPDLPFRAGELE